MVVEQSFGIEFLALFINNHGFQSWSMTLLDNNSVMWERDGVYCLAELVEGDDLFLYRGLDKSRLKLSEPKLVNLKEESSLNNKSIIKWITVSNKLANSISRETSNNLKSEDVERKIRQTYPNIEGPFEQFYDYYSVIYWKIGKDLRLYFSADGSLIELKIVSNVDEHLAKLLK